MHGQKLNTIYDIETGVFWSFATKIYPMEQDWHLLDHRIQKITINLLGLEYIETQFDSDLNSQKCFFKFRITNKKKFLWARLKYGF